MINIRIATNAGAFRAEMQKRRKQVAFATARALTWTGREAKAEVETRIDRVFDRPTPFTRKSVAAIPARKDRLRARVLIKDRQATYLTRQEEGGTRYPEGRALVVPVGVRRNKYGNIARGGVKRLLARDDTFSGSVGGVAGLWQRQRGGGVKLLVAWEPRARYQPRFGFRGEVRGLALKRFGANFERSFREAMATAR